MAARAWDKFVAGYRLISGTKLNNIFTGADQIAGLALNGALTTIPQVLTATGTTQLGAAAISAATALALVTVATTASTHGVRLPTAATGLSIQVGNAATFGVKVYPATGGQIGAASTNAADATVLAINKTNTYIAINKTKWVVNRGA